MDKPLISVRDLVKSYRMGDVTVQALRGVGLEIRKGEFVAISGASGSGKSTFMNILGCLDTPTTGTYQLDGIDVQSLSPDALSTVRNRKLGFVFQSYNLLARTTALENVELPMLYRKNLGAGEGRKRARLALEAVGLDERAHHYPNQLSGGQQQRVAIARAMVNEPVLILADEPTGNLDTRSSLEIISLFQALNARGITLILVTHEPDIALYASRQVVFRDGKIIQDIQNPNPLQAKSTLAALPVDESALPADMAPSTVKTQEPGSKP